MSTEHDTKGWGRRLAGMLRGRGLAIGLFIGGCACFALTILMNRAFGSSIGATEEGKVLLGGAAIVIDIVGIGLFGMAAGSLASPGRHWATRLMALPIALVVLACAGNSIMSNMNFVASQRLAVTKAQEAHAAAIKARNEREEAARQERLRRAEDDARARREAQERLAQTQLGFMQAELKDAKGKDRKVLRKDFSKGAAEIIAEIGKDSQPAPEPTLTGPAAEIPIVIVQTEGGAEIIASLTGMEEKVLRLMQMAYIAILLTVLKTMAFPLAGFLGAARGIPGGSAAVVAIPPTPDVSQAVAPVVLTPVAADAAPRLALAGPSGMEPEATADQRPAETSVPVAPDPTRTAASNPFLGAPIAGAEAKLRSMGFPMDGRPAGPQREKIGSPREAAVRFLEGGLQPFGFTEAPIWIDDMRTLYRQFCVADHREMTSETEVIEALRSMKSKGITYSRMRIGPESENKRWGYVVAAKRYPKAKADDLKTDTVDPAPEEVGRTARGPFSAPSLVAANDAPPLRPDVLRSLKAQGRAPRVVSNGERLAIAEARAAKAIERGLSRKQRGSRVHRIGRAA